MMMQAFGGSSPMEIQLHGATAGEMSDGIWIPVTMQQKCSNTPDRDNAQPGRGVCSWNATTSTKLVGWDEVTVPLNGVSDDLKKVSLARNPRHNPHHNPHHGYMALQNITGIRYGWGGNPCCPGVNRFMIPCPPNSCPIQTFNSSMPAPP